MAFRLSQKQAGVVVYLVERLGFPVLVALILLAGAARLGTRLTDSLVVYLAGQQQIAQRQAVVLDQMANVLREQGAQLAAGNQSHAQQIALLKRLARACDGEGSGSRVQGSGEEHSAK